MSYIVYIIIGFISGIVFSALFVYAVVRWSYAQVRKLNQSQKSVVSGGPNSTVKLKENVVVVKNANS